VFFSIIFIRYLTFFACGLGISHFVAKLFNGALAKPFILTIDHAMNEDTVSRWWMPFNCFFDNKDQALASLRF